MVHNTQFFFSLSRTPHSLWLASSVQIQLRAARKHMMRDCSQNVGFFRSPLRLELWSILYGDGIVMVLFSWWWNIIEFFQEICHKYILPTRHLPFNYEKVKVWKNKQLWLLETKFNSVWSNNLGKTQHIVAMEKNLENYDFGLKDTSVKILKKNTDNVIKSHKCTNATIWGHIWKCTVEKSQTNATNVTIPHLRQAISGHIESTQWIKVKQMHPVWLCIFLC